jgi:GTP cyclohydrolase I
MYSPVDMEAAVRGILQFVGDNPDREGLLDTPKRVVKAWGEMFAGYAMDPKEILKTFADGAEDSPHKVGGIVLMCNIPVKSRCEHHMEAIDGVAHVAYIPKDAIVGLSKLDRLVDCFARRLQVQERLTAQVVDAIEEHLSPIGSACIITATHGCMGHRGVNHPQVATTTSAMRGAFRLNDAARSELLQLIAMQTHRL